MRIQAPILCLALIAGACSSPEQMPETDVATPVSVVEITMNPIEEYVTATGTAEAASEVLLNSENSGYYRRAVNPRTGKPFAIGDTVNKGDIIIYLDNPEQVNNIGIESRKLELDLSETEFEQQKTLHDMGGVTQRELTDSERAFMSAKSNYEIGLLQLEKLKVIAPFNGIIVDLPTYTEDTMVSSGSEMVHLMDYKTLLLDINLPGKHLGNVTTGQTVRISNYNTPDSVLTGAITQVAPVLDPEGRTFKASVTVNNSTQVIRPGMFVKAEVVVARRDSTIVIPKDIVMTRRNRQIVYVVDRGYASERPITTGLENPEEIEVLEGLTTDDRLVIEGFETLRNRSRVRIVD